MGPKSSVVTRGIWERSDRQKRRKQIDKGGRGWSNASRSQGIAGTTMILKR